MVVGKGRYFKVKVCKTNKTTTNNRQQSQGFEMVINGRQHWEGFLKDYR
jgi:hypothetical protein